MEKQTPQILHLQLPKGMVFTEHQLIEFSEINHKEVESVFENGYFTLIIHLMGNFAKSTSFTAEIMFQLSAWNHKHKLGKVYSETQMYRVREHTYREADTSFVAFAIVPKEEQKEWFDKMADKPATLLVEVSGNKVNAQIDLDKTIEYWIPFGTKYVLVINLEEREWYFFNGSVHYSTHSFSEKFIAPADMPDLVIDFDEICENCDF